MKETSILKLRFCWSATWVSNLLFISKLHTDCNYEVCLKSKGTVQCARYTNNFYRKEKSIAFHDVTMSYGFENQISAFCGNILFCTFFCQGTFFVTALWKFDKIKNFWLFFSLVRRMSVEQQFNLKFLVRLGKTPTEALKFLQEVYTDDTMSRTWWRNVTMTRCQVFEWDKRFKEGREEVEDDHRSGRPSTSRTNENVERVRQKERSDHRLTVRMIADELGMSSERVWRIITEDLGMWKICAKMVPYQSCWPKDKKSGVCNRVKTFWSNSKLNPTCRKELLLAMSHGSSSMIHSPNGRALNGRAHCHQDPKRRGSSSPKPRWCWSLLLMFMELSTQNSCHNAKLLISTSTKTSCDVWCAQRGRKEEISGKRGHGCFIMTMLQLIMPSEFGSFLPKITLLYWSDHPTL